MKSDNCKCKNGPTSYGMQNPEAVFDKLGLREGDFFLDAGCGMGDYSIHASKIVGKIGKVFALDRQNLVDNFDLRISVLNLKNIETKTFDITKKFPIKSESIDVCFIANVLHAIDISKQDEFIFNEIKRILKTNGKLAIIECKKENLSFGPPLEMRLSSEEIEFLAQKYGFKKNNYTDLGFNYLIQLKKQ